MLSASNLRFEFDFPHRRFRAAGPELGYSSNTHTKLSFEFNLFHTFIDNEVALSLADGALGEERGFLGLFLDLNDELGLSTVTALVFAHISAGSVCHCARLAGFEELQLVSRVGIAFLAIGLDGFGHFHKQSQSE
jgi:hypothetical protein